MTSSAGGNAEQKKADLAACQAMLVSPAKGKPSCTAQTGEQLRHSGPRL